MYLPNIKELVLLLSDSVNVSLWYYVEHVYTVNQFRAVKISIYHDSIYGIMSQVIHKLRH